MSTGRSAYFGNVFLGAFGRPTDDFVFLGNPHEKLIRACETYLGAEPINITINSSNLAGLFISANSNGAVFPEFAFKEEMAKAKGKGLNTVALGGRLTAIGNNIAANDKFALANPDFSKEQVKEISDCLGVEVIQTAIAGYKTVGSACALTNRGFILHSHAGQELAGLEELLGMKGGIGTANMGVPFVGMCILANSKGLIAGEDTGGFEMHRMEEALGLLEAAK